MTEEISKTFMAKIRTISTRYNNYNEENIQKNKRYKNIYKPQDPNQPDETKIHPVATQKRKV